MQGIIKEILWISLAVGMLGGTLVMLWSVKDSNIIMTNICPPSMCRF